MHKVHQAKNRAQKWSGLTDVTFYKMIDGTKVDGMCQIQFSYIDSYESLMCICKNWRRFWLCSCNCCKL